MLDKSPTVTFLIVRLTGFLVYVSFGILYHMVSSPHEFSWADPWVWITMGLWPLFLLGWVIMGIISIMVVVTGIWYFFDELPNRKRRKQLAAERRAAFEQRRREAAKRA